MYFNLGKYRGSNLSAKTAWDKYMKEISVNVTMVRTLTRVMIGKWQIYFVIIIEYN